MTVACERGDARTVSDVVLTGANIACLENEAAPFTTAEEAEVACRILTNPAVRDIVQRLLSQKRAARRAGFRWSQPSTADAADAGDP